MDNLNRILTPEYFSGGTRFPLPFLADSTYKKTQDLLIKEFKDESCKIRVSKSYAKLIFADKIIEINPNYVFFLPQLLPTTAEDIRKRIFKNIANKPSVYQQTSMDNLCLSKRTLVEGDLRVSVSLLYYSIHKAITSLQQRMLEGNFGSNVNDNIKFEELGHFTDIIFYKDYDKYDEVVKEYNKCVEDNKNIAKLETVLCKYSKFGVNPFRVTSIIVEKVDFNNLSLYENAINYLAKTIVNNLEPNRIINDKDIYNTVGQMLDSEFQETLISKGSISNQEKRVGMAILKSIYTGWNSDNVKIKARSYILAVFLRLYWLRQTADYAFDFEVKTSYKEISLLIFICEWLLNSLFNYNNSSINNDNLKDYNEIDNMVSETNISDNIIEICDNNYFIEDIDSVIFNDIIFDNVNSIYIKAIWQDGNFDYQRLMISIYKINGVHTENAEIIYFTQKLAFYIRKVQITISNDCVFLFKINIANHLLDLLIVEESKRVVFELLKELINNYCNISECDFGSIKILLSKPRLNHEFPQGYLDNIVNSALDSYKISSFKLTNVSATIHAKIKTLLKNERFTSYRRRIRTGSGDEDYFELDNPGTYENPENKLLLMFNIISIVDGNQLLRLENDNLLIQIPQFDDNRSEDYFNLSFSIILYNNNILDYTKTANNFVDSITDIFDNYNLQNCTLEKSAYAIPITVFAQEVDSLSIDKIKVQMIEGINEVAYELIKECEIIFSDSLLSLSENIAENVYVIATRGLWYFYNKTLSYEDRMSKGSQKYLESIELAQKTDFKNIDSLMQKFNMEKARLLIANNHFVEAYSLLNETKSLNSSASYFDEVIEMIKLCDINDSEITTEIIEEAAISN